MSMNKVTDPRSSSTKIHPLTEGILHRINLPVPHQHMMTVMTTNELSATSVWGGWDERSFLIRPAGNLPECRALDDLQAEQGAFHAGGGNSKAEPKLVEDPFLWDDRYCGKLLAA
jgi:hypothetical protein